MILAVKKGAVVIDTKLNTQKISGDFKDLEKKTQNLINKYNKSVDSIKSQELAISKVKSKLDELVNGNRTPSDIKNLETQLKNSEKEVENLQKEYDTLINDLNSKTAQLNIEMGMGDLKNPDLISSLQNEINKLDVNSVPLADKLENARDKANSLKVELEKIKLNPNCSTEIQELQNKLDNLNSKLAQTKDEANQTKEEIRDAFNQKKSLFDFNGALNSIKGGFDGVGKKIDSFKKRVTRLILTVAVFNLIRQGLTVLRNSFVTLLKTNDTFSNSLNQIKANLMTAFAPIYNAILPAINTLMNALSKVTGAIATFVSSLFGLSTKQATNQAKKLSNALDDASKSGENANDSIASFDKIDVLDKDKDKGSGGKSDTGIDYSGDIETSSALLNFLNKIKDAISTIDFSNLNNAFKIFIDAVKSFGTGLYQGLQGFYENLLLPLAKWTIEDALPRFLKATAKALKSVNWNKFNASLNNLWKALLPFTINVGTGLLWFYENVLLPLSTFIMNDVIPSFINILSSALSILNEVITDVQPVFTWLWEEILKPMAEWTGGLIVGVLDGIGNALKWISENEIAITILESLAAAILLYNTYLAVTNTISTITTALKTGETAVLWANVAAWIAAVAPVIAVIAAITAVIAIIILCVKHWDIIWNTVKKVVNSIKNAVATAFKAIGTTISNVMNSILTTITNIWNAILDTIKGVINGIIWAVEKMVNTIIKGLNKIIEPLVKLGNGVLDLIGLDNFKLSVLPEVKLPRLATGTVIPPRHEFAAILGDQKHGTNIEAPLDTIKQGVREENQELIKQLLPLLKDNEGAREIVLKFTGTLAQLVRLLKPELDEESKRKGIRIINEVA